MEDIDGWMDSLHKELNEVIKQVFEERFGFIVRKYCLSLKQFFKNDDDFLSFVSEIASIFKSAWAEVAADISAVEIKLDGINNYYILMKNKKVLH